MDENDLSMPVDLKTDTLFTEANLFKLKMIVSFWYQRIHHIVMDGYDFHFLAKR